MKTSKTGPRLKKPGGEGLLRASPFLLPSLIGLAIFYLAPMVVSIFISLTDWNGLDRLFADGFMQEHFIGLDNYKAILTSQEFWKVLKNTLTYIVLYLPLMMAVSLAVASLLSQQRRGVGVFRVLYYIPVLTSWVAASLIWKSILAPQYRTGGRRAAAGKPGVELFFKPQGLDRAHAAPRGWGCTVDRGRRHPREVSGNEMVTRPSGGRRDEA